MEYQVPQFIEVEDKLVGPLTLKQFIYIAGSAGLCAIFIAFLPLFVAIILSLPVVALGAALSFYKVNGKPFIEVLEAGFNYLTSTKLMLWKYTPPTEEKGRTAAAEAAAQAEAAKASHAGPRLTRGKLSELAWSLDVPTATRPIAKE